MISNSWSCPPAWVSPPWLSAAAQVIRTHFDIGLQEKFYWEVSCRQQATLISTEMFVVDDLPFSLKQNDGKRTWRQKLDYSWRDDDSNNYYCTHKLLASPARTAWQLVSRTYRHKSMSCGLVTCCRKTQLEKRFMACPPWLLTATTCSTGNSHSL